MKQIPNLFTLCNLFCGCMAIVFILQPDVSLNEDQNALLMNSRFMLAPLWLFAAAVIDFLDGFVARWMKSTSALGAQLDSLSDVVSFGVAPSMIIYKLLQFSYMSEKGAINVSLLLLMPAFLIALAAAWRLAVFNLDKSQTHSFRGAPTPITAIVVASFPLILWYDQQILGNWIMNPWFLYLVILLLSGMMVSSFPMMSLKVKERKLSAWMPQLILLFSGGIFLLFFKWAALPLIYVLYLVLSLAFRKQLIKN
jgi:CDP-diacylglycerol--serine O-phosphatidyltransferase